jgi:hypothetical protein
MRSTLPKEYGLGQVAVDQKPANFAQEYKRRRNNGERHRRSSTLDIG